ncbi:hypothetical protein [Ruania zhangjianzhongii]|uniref:hypothetical protein n=1 Tax=Ruania zhangjianzhongii TaxID=2603206 RepID=UPI0011CB7B7C|nr:hypothetical protein [Ruania zhangjianzhongii]
MPYPGPPRSAVVILTGGLLATALTGCSLLGVGEAEAAREAAAEHVNLVATGADPEALWRTTATEEPAQLRTASRMLAGASERIEVLDVGEAEPLDGRADVPFHSDLDGSEARQVSVTYRLAGTEYDATVVLAPHENRPLNEAESWAVLVPLTGAVTVPPVSFGSIVMDTYVAGVNAQIGDDYSAGMLPLYPAAYEIEQRADPYLASGTEELTVLAGQTVELVNLPAQGTDEAAAELTDELAPTIEGCADRSVPCSDSVRSWIEGQGIDFWATGWSLEVTTTPELTLDGNQAQFTGGTLMLTRPDGMEQELDLAGTVPWVMDNQSWTPRVLGQEIAVSGAAR